MSSSGSNKPRAYISNRFVLDLDDGSGMQYVGTLQGVEGGAFKSEAIDEKVGNEGLVLRHPGRPKFEDITIQVGMSMAPRFWKWIKASFNYDAQRRNGAIVALDYDNRERWRRTFQGALLTEVGFPQLDGASKEPAYLTVKFAVEGLTEEEPSMKKHPAEQENQDEWRKQRLWLPANFTFSLDHFNQGNPLNAKVDGFTVKQNVITCPTGGILEPTKEPGRVEFPNLAVTVLQRDAGPWMDWYNDFVRKGNYDPSQEKTGHILYLSRNMDQNNPLLGLDIYGIGILGVSPVKHDTKQEQMQKVKIDLYCETIDLKPGSGSVA